MSFYLHGKICQPGEWYFVSSVQAWPPVRYRMYFSRFRRAYFGTNPISFAAPRVEKDPLCLDMATSKIPWNRVEQSRRSGATLPEGQ